MLTSNCVHVEFCILLNTSRVAAGSLAGRRHREGGEGSALARRPPAVREADDRRARQAGHVRAPEGLPRRARRARAVLIPAPPRTSDL